MGAALKAGTKPERVTRTRVDTIEVTPAIIQSWKLSSFQRPLKVNKRVLELAEKIREDGGVIPGIITLGYLGKDQKSPFLLDGQHRREAFLISQCPVGYVDIREAWFDTMADMGQAFVELNSSLVRFGPDDVLRGLEQSSLPLTKIRQQCPWVGYDNVRRGPGNALLSMSAALRCWAGGRSDVPGAAIRGGVTTVAQAMTIDDTEQMCGFLNLAYKAWGKEPEFYRLWGNLNLTVCSWLYQHVVLETYSYKAMRLTKDQFGRGLMSVSADGRYIDWLVGRNMAERNRGPCYNAIKLAVARRIAEETGKKINLPAPAWLRSA